MYIDAVGAARVIAGVGPLLSEARRVAIERVLSARLDSLHVAVEQPEDPYNAAAVVRTAEALGIMHVHVVGAPDGSLHARKTTQGSFNWLHTRHHAQLPELLATLQAQGVRLFGAAPDAERTLEELPVDAPFCLLFGNEASGLSQAALAACALRFRIPMYGMSESLNLSVSAAIALYATSRARRAQLGRDSDLSEEAALRERARYYARSIDRRVLRAL
jgi:tRNA (guanosine-2'-O-)-methyltransferase